ncbi:hypothetical protein OXX79_000026 [Metschnikowia pulcherrima]|uniref:4a-hydroxytetrahydrobiopterin dehydratase n=1 Tax=Metschnikowia pulcherrima TaxID=27326 RepID=A0A8H7GQJ8_9ASCO|nr:hypothetical protein HF325_003718 [Metschnikowia pulcherrima]
MKINVPLVANAAKAMRPELEVLSKSALQAELATINNVLPKPYWTVSETSETAQLKASYTLKNYLKTWEFLNDVAASSHKLKHHPTITTTYNKVDIALTTHDVGNKVTYMDTKLATAIQNVYASKYAQTAPSYAVHTPRFTMNRAFKIIDELTKRD